MDDAAVTQFDGLNSHQLYLLYTKEVYFYLQVSTIALQDYIDILKSKFSHEVFCCPCLNARLLICESLLKNMLCCQYI